MSNIKELKPGLRWARHQKHGYRKEWSRWVVVKLTGKFPFMKAQIVFDPGGEERTDPYDNPENPDTWQYGPELEIPSEHWIEVVADKKYER